MDVSFVVSFFITRFPPFFHRIDSRCGRRASIAGARLRFQKLPTRENARTSFGTVTPTPLVTPFN